MNAQAQFAALINKAHNTQQLINQVLHQGTPVMLVCSTCGRRTDHRELRQDGLSYTVCRTCHSLTTNA